MIFRYLVVKGTQDIFYSKHGIMHNMICTNHASSKKFFVYNVIFFANIISQFMIFKVSMPTGCSLIVIELECVQWLTFTFLIGLGMKT